jgi:hypothetical protein
MQPRFGARAATVTIMFAALVAAGVMAACHNGPSNDHDTNGVNTGGASGQVMPSAADTIHHTPATAGATAAPSTTPASAAAVRRDTARRRPEC